MHASLALFAQAAGTVTEKFEFGRVAQMTPISWALLSLAAVAIIAMVIWFYLRDCTELGGGLATILIVLRLSAFLGLFWIFLQPQQRIERPLTINSKVYLLFDTSLSMLTTDEGSRPRIDEVVDQMEKSELIAELRKTHDLVVMRFDSSEQIVGTLVKIPPLTAAIQSPLAEKQAENLYEKYWPALVIGGVALLLLSVLWLSTNVSLKVRAVSTVPILLIGLVVLAVWSANFTDLWTSTRTETVTNPEEDAAAAKQASEQKADWRQWLEIQGDRGRETRLVETLTRVVEDNVNLPAIAGIILVTDGRNTDGIDPASVLKNAKSHNLKIFTVGIGSDKEIAQVSIADFNVPAKAYAGDKYLVTVIIHGAGLGDKPVDVILESQDADKPADSPDNPVKAEGKISTTLESDGSKVVVPFTLKPEATGRRRLIVRVVPPGGVTNKEDQIKTEIIEIVDVKTRVLLLASGPTREFRFLRNQLSRDESMVVDLLLQTIANRDGISQDANKILLDFPKDKAALREYHCIVAFDPDWSKLKPEEIDLLENWVAKDAGGLILIPGPIHTDEWIIRSQNDEALGKIRALFPVVFKSEIDFGDDRINREPRRIFWGREDENDRGRVKTSDPPQFLWLSDSPASSARAWKEFDGFYSCYAVARAKQTAKVYALLPEPNNSVLEVAPVLMARQFYGSGRVFYLGSGEMWRIRAVKEEYFETFYTKLIRHVSQGSLLRGSKRGMLLVEDAYDVGQTVIVRVSMEDAQGNDFIAASITLEYISPDDQFHSLTLKAVDAEKKPGQYSGQFTVTRKGAYRLRVPIPDSGEMLTKNIKVRFPDRENRNTRRNTQFLANISAETQGRLYLGMAEMTDISSPSSLVNQLGDRTEITSREDDPNSLWDNHWTLIAVCGLLCLEWLIRRLCKLA